MKTINCQTPPLTVLPPVSPPSPQFLFPLILSPPFFFPSNRQQTVCQNRLKIVFFFSLPMDRMDY